MNVAIVGAGIAGLTAASVLARRHRVTVFEAEPRVGGHTNTAAVREGERLIPVDTGFIVFNEPNYPLLCRLFERLGVASRASDMSFSVHCEKSGLEYNGTSLNTLFAQRANLVKPRFWGMLADILRFAGDARERLKNGLDDRVTVSDYAASAGYGKAFLEHYLVPLGASLWSCSAERFARFPVRFVMEFLANHGMLEVNGRPTWRTVIGGSSTYLDRLIAPFADRIRLACPVLGVARSGAGVELTLSGNRRERFDEVVLAGHADQSLAMLRDADDDERAVLECFPYQANEVVLHTDPRVLPREPRAWASWNYRIPREPRELVSVTYNMNMLQGIESERTYCVSLNQRAGIDPRRVIRRIRYHHPLFGSGRTHAQSRHRDLLRRRGISYCGAYWGYGFHEDGVRSALAVCAAFDMDLDS
ncbi:MAG: FAD-dependent oxidoreductase [Gammaproteobacteria bacterium]|nr:FAD-dependent oxidoreductase [Gammaproteobacteria bacterium]